MYDVNIDLSARRNVEYAKCRAVIEREAKNRMEKRRAKQIVIEFLGGKVMPGQEVITKKHGEYVNKKLRAYVVFPDNTKAVL